MTRIQLTEEEFALQVAHEVARRIVSDTPPIATSEKTNMYAAPVVPDLAQIVQEFCAKYEVIHERRADSDSSLTERLDDIRTKAERVSVALQDRTARLKALNDRLEEKFGENQKRDPDAER